jgi:uncharacterized protein (DUF1778 family)
MTGKERRVSVNVRMTEEQHALLKQAARDEARSLSSFLLYAALERAAAERRRRAEQREGLRGSQGEGGDGR